MAASSSTTTASHKPRLKRGSKPTLYHIESRTRPGIFYIADAHRLTCTCEAGRHKRACWHLHAAVQWHAYRKHMHGKAQHVQAAAAATGTAALAEVAA